MPRTIITNKREALYKISFLSLVWFLIFLGIDGIAEKASREIQLWDIVLTAYAILIPSILAIALKGWAPLFLSLGFGLFFIVGSFFVFDGDGANYGGASFIFYIVFVSGLIGGGIGLGLGYFFVKHSTAETD